MIFLFLLSTSDWGKLRVSSLWFEYVFIINGIKGNGVRGHHIGDRTSIHAVSLQFYFYFLKNYCQRSDFIFWSTGNRNTEKYCCWWGSDLSVLVLTELVLCLTHFERKKMALLVPKPTYSPCVSLSQHHASWQDKFHSLNFGQLKTEVK